MNMCVLLEKGQEYDMIYYHMFVCMIQDKDTYNVTIFTYNDFLSRYIDYR